MPNAQYVFVLHELHWQVSDLTVVLYTPGAQVVHALALSSLRLSYVPTPYSSHAVTSVVGL